MNPNVPSAKENEQKNGNSASSENVANEQAQEATSAPVLFDLSGFDAEKIEMAESLGIPIRKIAETMNAWSNSVEGRFRILAEAVSENPKQTIELLKKEASRAQEEYAKTHPAASPSGSAGGGGGDLANLMQIATLFTGGNQSNAFSDKIMQAFLDQGIASMNMTAKIGQAVLETVTGKVARTAGAAVAESIGQATGA